MDAPAVVRQLISSALIFACVWSPVPAAAREPTFDFSAQLPVSAAMTDRVRFWVDVFTNVSHGEVLLHDRDDPTLVYDVVPYGRDGDTSQIDATRASYERVLGQLATENLFQT